MTLQVIGEVTHEDEECAGRTNAMIPNIHIHEKLMFERAQEWRSEIEQQHLLASLRKPRPSRVQHMPGSLGTFFVALSTRMKLLVQGNEPSV
jgi:hypothetical protein